MPHRIIAIKLYLAPDHLVGLNRIARRNNINTGPVHRHLGVHGPLGIIKRSVGNSLVGAGIFEQCFPVRGEILRVPFSAEHTKQPGNVFLQVQVARESPTGKIDRYHQKIIFNKSFNHFPVGGSTGPGNATQVNNIDNQTHSLGLRSGLRIGYRPFRLKRRKDPEGAGLLQHQALIDALRQFNRPCRNGCQRIIGLGKHGA